MNTILNTHFDNLGLTPDAKEWLLDYWDVIQGLDDWRDKDASPDKEKEKVIYQVLVKMPSNPFFLAYSYSLLPIMSNMVLKWIGANKLEDSKEHFNKAYMWRAAYYDVVLEVVRLLYGYTVAAEASAYVAKMYGENFEDYIKEFENA
tara:strand:- start:1516 stop:1956 length:441 start_codon:yes stop_codon:yes gene_type:complete